MNINANTRRRDYAFSRRQKATTSIVRGQRQSLSMIDDTRLRFLPSVRNLVSFLTSSSPVLPNHNK